MFSLNRATRVRSFATLFVFMGLLISALTIGFFASTAGAAVPPQKLPGNDAPDDLTPQPLPFSQTWVITTQITIDDNWDNVPGIIGYRGDGLTGGTAVDPQTVLGPGEGTPVDVNANQSNPNTFTTGGLAEFHLTDPVVALAGSGTARAPHMVITLNTTGQSNIAVAYNLRDIDGSMDNSVQPVALQFRVGTSGNYTNLPAGFVADASEGPSLATLVTPVFVTLPVTAENQPLCNCGS